MSTKKKPRLSWRSGRVSRNYDLEDAVILPLLRNRRDYLERALDAELREAAKTPRAPLWLDYEALIAKLRDEMAQCNAAIARRL